MSTKKISELPEADHPFAGTEAVPLVQEGETKQVALANLLGEGAVLTWLAPYLVSPDGDAGENRAAINQAILDASARKRPPVLLLPAGRIPIDGPVILRRGVRLQGASAADLPIGTELFLVDGSNSSVVQNDDWPNGDRQWQWGELAYLRINGNKLGNPEGGSGIAIRHMGEASEIRSVVARNCARYGFEFTGTHTPIALRGCSVEGNTLGGLRVSGDGAAFIAALTGTGGGPLVMIDGGGAPSVLLLGASATHHQPVIRIEARDARLTFLGGSVTAPEGGGEVIQVVEGEPSIQVSGLTHRGYERLVRAADDGGGLAATGSSSGLALYNASVRAAGGGADGVRLGGSQDGSGEPRIVAGVGSPPADLSLPNGSLYLRSDGVAGDTFYVREGGHWVAK